MYTERKDLGCLLRAKAGVNHPGGEVHVLANIADENEILIVFVLYNGTARVRAGQWPDYAPEIFTGTHEETQAFLKAEYGVEFNERKLQ